MFVQGPDKHTRSSFNRDSLPSQKRDQEPCHVGEREKTPLREGWLLLTSRCVETLLKLHDETAP